MYIWANEIPPNRFTMILHIMAEMDHLCDQDRVIVFIKLAELHERLEIALSYTDYIQWFRIGSMIGSCYSEELRSSKATEEWTTIKAEASTKFKAGGFEVPDLTGFTSYGLRILWSTIDFDLLSPKELKRSPTLEKAAGIDAQAVTVQGMNRWWQDLIGYRPVPYGKPCSELFSFRHLLQRVEKELHWYRMDSNGTAEYITIDDDPQMARNKWIYFELRRGAKHVLIIAQLAERARTLGWEPIETSSGLNQAARRHCDRYGLPHLKPRTGGRPKKR
jgi:hypothetical protein